MRELECVDCHELVTVIGDPDWIDANLYRCDTCREPTGKTIQLEIGDGTHLDLVEYRPDMAEIPF